MGVSDVFASKGESLKSSKMTQVNFIFSMKCFQIALKILNKAKYFAQIIKVNFKNFKYLGDSEWIHIHSCYFYSYTYLSAFSNPFVNLLSCSNPFLHSQDWTNLLFIHYFFSAHFNPLYKLKLSGNKYLIFFSFMWEEL